jgi:surface carbohydrate biosynthesis protein (TIGR04326 family)
MDDTGSTLLIWDRAEAAPRDAQVLCWRSYERGAAISSLPEYLELHGERVRARYLAFIDSLAERRMAGRRIVDHLAQTDGYSFWWMTLLVEKSPFKSPRIYDCLRLIALEEIMRARNPRRLVLVSADRALAAAIRRLTVSAGIEFRWQRVGDSSRGWSVRGLYAALPSPIKGLLSLRHYLQRWPLRRVREPRWFAGENSAFICSYFIHLDPQSCAAGQFRSRYWGNLPQLLHGSGQSVNWMQLFLLSAAVPNVATGLRWVRSFNRDPGVQGRHGFLESYLSCKVILAALRRWLWLTALSWRLRNVGSEFGVENSAVWLWPLLRSDWYASLSGTTGMANCMLVALFDAALADLPRQRIGLYLFENQAWERALLRAWRRHGHGRIIGVQHSTAPFWYLPYTDDPAAHDRPSRNAPPYPDRVAVNGSAARSALMSGGFRAEMLVDVEALRYLSLAEAATSRQRRLRSRSVPPGLQPPASSQSISVLVLGEIDFASTHHLLQMLEGAVALLTPAYRFMFKAHPGCAVDLANYPALAAAETQQPLGEILSEYAAVVAANSTSAAVDAFIAGVPVITTLDGGSLNLSPLRGRPGVHFVTSSEALAASLQMLDPGAAAEAGEDFFLLDGGLPRWQQLLGTAGAPS